MIMSFIRYELGPRMPFSPFLTGALVDVITGGVGQGPGMREPIGIYRSGPKIEQFFLDCGLDLRIGNSSRVPATTDFLRQTASAWDGDQAIERVVLRAADPRDYFANPEKGHAVIEHLNRALEPDGFAITIINFRILI